LKKLTTWASSSGRWRPRKSATASIHSRVRAAVSHEYAPPPLAGVAAIARAGRRGGELALGSEELSPNSKVRFGPVCELGYNVPVRWAGLGFEKTNPTSLFV
jgi:hypothetical protein